MGGVFHLTPLGTPQATLTQPRDFANTADSHLPSHDIYCIRAVRAMAGTRTALVVTTEREGTRRVRGRGRGEETAVQEGGTIQGIHLECITLAEGELIGGSGLEVMQCYERETCGTVSGSVVVSIGVSEPRSGGGWGLCRHRIRCGCVCSL